MTRRLGVFAAFRDGYRTAGPPRRRLAARGRSLPRSAAVGCLLWAGVVALLIWYGTGGAK